MRRKQLVVVLAFVADSLSLSETGVRQVALINDLFDVAVQKVFLTNAVVAPSELTVAIH